MISWWSKKMRLELKKMRPIVQENAPFKLENGSLARKYI